MNPKASRAALEQRSTDTLDPALAALSMFVLEHADGARPVAELAEMASSWRSEAVRIEDVFCALDELADHGLLEARVAPPAGTGRIGRRRIGQAAAATAVALLMPRLAAAGPEAGRQREEGDEKRPPSGPTQTQAEQSHKTAAEQSQKRKSSQPEAPGRGATAEQDAAREQQQKAVERGQQEQTQKTAPAAPRESDKKAPPADAKPKGQSEQDAKASARQKSEQDSKASARAKSEQDSKASARAKSEQDSKASARAKSEQDSKASARARSEQDSKASARARSEQNPKTSVPQDQNKPQQ